MLSRGGAVAIAVCVLACGRFGYEERQQDARSRDTGGSDDLDDGFVTDGPTGDVPFVCPTECNGGCANNECHIDGDALTTIVCPPGIPCVITCSGFQSCKADIMCGSASSCTVHCVGDHSCYFGVECGAGPCTLDCSGPDACPAVSHCNNSTDCNITCSGVSSCGFTNHCGTGKCNVDCTGMDSCKGSVDCATSCQCDVTCAAIAFCPQNPGIVTCPTGCSVADGCDSTLPNCATCP